MENVLHIEGMMCSNCSARVEKVLGALSGVESVKVDLDAKSARVVGNVTYELLKDTVEDLGYTVI